VAQVKDGGGPEDGPGGLAPQDPRRAMQGSALILLIALYLLVFRGMRKRDLLLRRYWRREDDET
jgi:hypothetical protein